MNKPSLPSTHWLIALVATSLGIGASAVMAGQNSGFATAVDGVRIHYMTQGSGVPMFVIAGGPGGGSDRLRYTHTLLQGCAKLVFIDNRGRGRSVVAPAQHIRYSLDDDLEDIEAVRKAIGADRIIVYGHSYGSMVAMAYAARFPERTIALITSAGVHGARVWQERNIDGVKRFLRDHYPDKWARIVGLHDQGRLTSESELADLFRGLDELFLYNPESRSRLNRQFSESGDPRDASFNPDVYRAMLGDDPEWTVRGALKGVELLPELGNYKGPALIIGGRFDRICPPINQVEIAASLENAQLVMFEESGHSPFVEEPLRFLKVVCEFLHQVTPPREK